MVSKAANSDRSLPGTGFRVGDRVWVPIPLGRAAGTVIEDRGPLGSGGQHLFRVSVPNHPHTSEVFLVSEVQMQHIPPNEEEAERCQFDRETIKNFLIDGGLISILVHNSPEPVWLRRGPRGNVTFTNIDGYSQNGGKIPPAYVLEGERISAPKQEEVIQFMKSFGLTDNDARDVISHIGTAP